MIFLSIRQILPFAFSNQVAQFHQRINSIFSHIQFTMQEGQDLFIPFLDILVIRHCHKLHTQMYKNIDTRTGISITIYTTPCIRSPVAIASRDRAKTHNTNKQAQMHKINNILCVFQLNGFPLCRFYPNPEVTHNSTKKIYQHFTIIPCTQSKSQNIRRFSNDGYVKVDMRPVNTMKKFLPFRKDPFEYQKKVT